MSDEKRRRLWTDELLRNPHAVADKRLRVQRMFGAIAPAYDLNNRLLTLGMDQCWRRQAVRLTGVAGRDVVVDVACGTGDLAIQFVRAGAGRVIGVDFAMPMLVRFRRKVQVACRSSSRPDIVCADALRLPLPDRCADVVSIAFGLRNMTDPQAALAEFHRVLRPGGRLAILEFSLPDNWLVRALYSMYFRWLLPLTAMCISRDRTGAYTYLPESVRTFIGRDAILRLMTRAGFLSVRARPLSMGICVLYWGHRAAE